MQIYLENTWEKKHRPLDLECLLQYVDVNNVLLLQNMRDREETASVKWELLRWWNSHWESIREIT
jgi:hypothetical protein